MSIIFVTSKPSPNTEYRYALVKTCWGSLAFVCRDSIVYRLFFGFSKPQHLLAEIKKHFPTAYLDNGLLKGLQRDLTDYFHGRHTEFTTSTVSADKIDELTVNGAKLIDGATMTVAVQRTRSASKSTYQREGTPVPCRDTVVCG